MPTAISTVVTGLAGSDRTAILRISGRKTQFNELLNDVHNTLNNFAQLTPTNDAQTCQRLVLVIDRMTEPEATPGKDSTINGGTVCSIERMI